MNRLLVGALVVPLLLPAAAGPAQAAGTKAGACTPSPTVLHAQATPVPGYTDTQLRNATDIINAAAQAKVPQHGQTLAVMTALQASSLGAGSPDVFGQGAAQQKGASPTAAAQRFYAALVKVKGWQDLQPTLAAHAAQGNLDPLVYAPYWQRASVLVDKLTTGTGAAGMANLAARAQAIADCTAATVKGQFASVAGLSFVGPYPPVQLLSRAQDLAKNGGNGWHDQCQHFVAVLGGRASSGFSTALDAWQTFLSEGVGHPVTSPDGVSPPAGAWLYYRSSNPAGHVVTYLGNGQVASTDVFAEGRVGIGPASALTDGPWHLQYLGWAPPWGQR